MKSLSRKLTQSMSLKSSKSRAPFRPALEGLEDRTVPTVTPHGGAVLAHVKIQALFIGSQWNTTPGLYQQAQYLSGFVAKLVNGSYMDALAGAGYGVGRGSAAPARIDASAGSHFNVSKVVTADIGNHTLQFPDDNTLYICFTAPNVPINWDDGTTSATVGGFHDAFALHIPGVATPSRTVRVATVAYPGLAGNYQVPGLYALDSLTTVASREIADAVTDPDFHYTDSAHPGFTRARGWYDGARNAEIGDVITNRIVYINGYAVQRVVNKDDFVMTPAEAASNRVVNFVLQPNGNLLEITPSGSTLLSTAVAAVSDQGIDNLGRAMVDVVTADGHAFEVHDAGGVGAPATWVYLGSGVKSAKAGQGVSYVLFNTGAVFEFDDASGVSHYVAGSVTGLAGVPAVAQIDAGTDAQGVNAVDALVPTIPVITLNAHVAVAGVGPIVSTLAAYEYSDDGGAHFIVSGVKSVSAGRQGNSAYITTAGLAYWHSQVLGLSKTAWGGGVTRVTAGTDANGTLMIELLYGNGVLREYRPGTGVLSTVAGGVKDMSKGRLGAVDVVLVKPLVVKATMLAGGAGGVLAGTPSAWEHTASGWRFLSDNATAAV